MRTSRRLGLGSCLGLGLALSAGLAQVGGCSCGSSDTGSGGFAQAGGASTHHGTGTDVGGQGGSILSANGGSGAGTTGSSINPDAACATSSADATLIPLNMYIMFDDSGSMGDNNKWTNASAALNGFFGDSGSAGLRVALRFFPDGDCDDNACDVNACATPAVPLGALTADPAPMDTQEGLLIASTNAHGPANGGGTPLFAALKGAEQFATAYQVANPTEKSVVVLVTDGEPNGCDDNIDHISQVAADAFAAAGILTFAVGLEGSSTDDMNQIAAAGGTNQAFFIASGNGAEQALLMALQAIRGTSVACDFAMPTADNMGHPIDPKKVNVDYTPGGMGDPKTIPQVANAAACGNKEGWYYDDPNNPTKITLCPHTCMEVQADQDAKIQILVGCKTEIPH